MPRTVAECLPENLAGKVCEELKTLKDILTLEPFCFAIGRGKTSIYEALSSGVITRKWARGAVNELSRHFHDPASRLYDRLRSQYAEKHVLALFAIMDELDNAKARPVVTPAAIAPSGERRDAAIFKYKAERRADLAGVSGAYYAEVSEAPDFPLIVRRSWLPERLTPLDEVDAAKQLEAEDQDTAPAATLPFTGALSCDLWSKSHNPSMLITDDPCYRLQSVEARAGDGQPPILRFGRCSYNGYYNTCEALAFELAAWRVDNPATPRPEIGALPARGAPEGVFDFSGRNAVAGQNALFVLHGLPDNQTTFLVHEREQKGHVQLAEAANTFHVVPAGTFQPDAAGGGLQRDFSLVRSILRELAEELLGHSEVETQQRLGRDFMRDPALRPYVEALESGAMRIFYLGLGLDPVTTKPEILLLIVLNARAVGLNGSEDLQNNWEGEPLVCDWSPYWLSHYARNPKTLPAGRACMVRALEFYDEIEAVIHEQSRL